MKTIKQISKVLLGVIILSTSINYTISAQDRKDTFEKTYDLNSSGNFSFSCYDTDLKINTWQKNEVKFTGEISIQGGKKEDQDKLIEVFKNPDVSNSNNSLNIETNISKNTIVVGPLKKITLVSGEVIRVDKFRVTYELWIPETVAFRLKSKYNNIEIANLTGKLDFDLYDVDLTILGFGSNSEINMKYSNASMGKGGDAKLNIYDSDLEIKEMDNARIESKYSDFTIGKTSTLNIHSYDDDFEVESTDNLKVDAKYSDLIINSNMTSCSIEFYDSDIDAQNINELDFSGKYSSIEALNVSNVEVTKIYDSSIELGEVGVFSCYESKYDDFKFDMITKSVSMPNTYSSQLRIRKTGTDFESFQGSFKYGSVNMPLGSDLNYSLSFETTYGSVNYSKERLKNNTINIKENSKQKFEGSTNENTKCEIKFTAYSTDFSFN